MIFHKVKIPDENEKPITESLEDIKKQTQAHQELVNELYELRRDLHEAEYLRDKVCEKGLLFFLRL